MRYVMTVPEKDKIAKSKQCEAGPGLPDWSNPPSAELSESFNVSPDLPMGTSAYGADTPVEGAGSGSCWVQARLNEIQPGWPAAQLEEWLYTKYLGPLADQKNLTAPALQLYLSWLIKRLGEMKYKPLTVAKYAAIYKQLAKAKIDDIKAQKKAEA